MWLYWGWEAGKWISMPPPTPLNLLPRSCLLCARKQLPVTGNEFCTSVKPFLWIKPAIGFKSASYSNRGDWLYSWRRFSVQCRVGERREGEEVKSLYSWLVHLILLTHSAGQSVPRGDLVDTGCRPSYNNKRMPLRREWTKGSDQRHLPKHIHKSRGATRLMEINMKLTNVLHLAFTIYEWH